MTSHVEGFHSLTVVSLDPASSVQVLTSSRGDCPWQVAESKVHLGLTSRLRGTGVRPLPETMAPAGKLASEPAGMYCKAVT